MPSHVSIWFYLLNVPNRYQKIPYPSGDPEHPQNVLDLSLCRLHLFMLSKRRHVDNVITSGVEKLKSKLKFKTIDCFLLAQFWSYMHSLFPNTMPYIHAYQAIPDISGSPIESQWGSLNIQSNPTGMIIVINRNIKGLTRCADNSDAFTMELPELTPWDLMTHMCVSDLILHWSRHWLFVCLVP